ncbi:MAG: EcsC family protein [Sphingobacteriaceae bacterium]|nr:MAG: EcsC family protein [Sphingobacteriaceae bacterium]
MDNYEQQAHIQLQFWQRRMQQKPSFGSRIAKGVQDKINSIIPDKVHNAITTAIEKMVKGVLFGARYTTKTPVDDASLQLREAKVKQQIEFYQKTASVEGAVTGAGGILMGLADFPILIGIKIKLLFDIAATYGYDVSDYKERLYILYVFQLAFSSQKGRNEVYEKIAAWQGYSSSLPNNPEAFDWRAFQQEYRDYIDLAKMAQLIPFIGAAVGAVVNYRLVAQLGETAINCYRMRKIIPLKILMPGEESL